MHQFTRFIFKSCSQSLKQLKAVALVLPLIFISTTVFAESVLNEVKFKEYSSFLDKIEQTLAAKKYPEKKLSDVLKEVAPIKSEALQCVSEQELQLEKVKLDLQTIGEPTEKESKGVREKRTELQSVMQKTEKRLASCRVLVLRTEEISKSLSSYQQSLLAARLLAVGPDLYDLIQVNLSKPAIWWQTSRDFVTDNSGLNLFSATKVALFVLMNAILYGITILVRRRLMRRVATKVADDSFSTTLLCNFYVVLAKYLPHVVMSLASALFIYLLTHTITPVPFVSVVVYGLPIYFIIKANIQLFLDPGENAETFHALPRRIAKALAKRLTVLLLMIFLGYLLFTTLLALSLPETVYLLVREVYASILILNVIWAVWILGKVPRFEETLAIRFVSTIVLLAILIAELLGYRNLASYASLGLAGSLLTLGFFMLVSRMLSELFEGLEKGRRRWQRKIRESLGVKKRKKLPELEWIKLILLASLWLLFIVVLLQLWGLSDAGFTQLKAIAFDGFTVGSLNVIPVRIVFAIVVLTLMLAVSSWLRTQLESSWLSKTNIERGAREATATISGYIGVAAAIIISLSVAGVEFGNLAIIAGALSVGIGFGMQNIVNNFVSGLILLFERPIKTGDWIVVGGTEGFVKKISIRSTQIETFDQADVIVPNSELISGQVTNWMLKDVRGRIRIPVGVAYGSDTELVKNILLEAAKNHDFVVNDNRSPEPKVMFMAFGESSLDFELRVFIKSIDKKPQVTSDLNFVIDSEFRKNNIEIPFPQRDLHIKSGKLED